MLNEKFCLCECLCVCVAGAAKRIKPPSPPLLLSHRRQTAHSHKKRINFISLWREWYNCVISHIYMGAEKRETTKTAAEGAGEKSEH